MIDPPADGPATMLLHHPAFQSLLLPLLLGLVATAVLRRPAAGRLAPWGPVLGLLAAWCIWPGLAWPPTARVQWLPWLLAAGVALGLAASLLRPAHPAASASPRSTGLAAALFVGALGLAGWAATQGSMKLAQLAASLAACLGLLTVGLRWGGGVGLPVRASARLPLLTCALVSAALAALIAWSLGVGVAGGAEGSPALDDPYLTPE